MKTADFYYTLGYSLLSAGSFSAVSVEVDFTIAQHLIFVNETLLSLVYTEPDVDCPVEIPLPGRTNEN